MNRSKTKKKKTNQRRLRAVIGYKKVATYLPNGTEGRAIAKLRIPTDAKIITVRGHGGKSRTNKAVVVSITPIAWGYRNSGRPVQGEGQRAVALRNRGYQGSEFPYVVGTTVRPERRFSTNRKEQCASGIHFFRSRAKALNY